LGVKEEEWKRKLVNRKWYKDRNTDDKIPPSKTIISKIRKTNQELKILIAATPFTISFSLPQN